MRAELLLVVAALSAASGLAGAAPVRASAPAGATATIALLRGIPQHGVDLGSPTAPVTVVEFADLQCPSCAAWTRESFPAIVHRYVRTGKVRLVFVGTTFLGPDSTKLLRTALAAGLQNRLWYLVDLLYRNQGRENSGWAGDRLLRSVGRAVPGLDVRKMLAARTSAAVRRQAAAAAQLAAGIQGTPSFAVGRSSGGFMLLRPGADAATIGAAVDSALGG
jgi:protein-disulfide isomerase